MVPSGGFQIFCDFAVFRFVTTISAGRRWAKYPLHEQYHKLKVTVAKWLLPGVAILPVNKWRLYTRFCIHTPRVCWFIPWSKVTSLWCLIRMAVSLVDQVSLHTRDFGRFNGAYGATDFCTLPKAMALSLPIGFFAACNGSSSRRP